MYKYEYYQKGGGAEQRLGKLAMLYILQACSSALPIRNFQVHERI